MAIYHFSAKVISRANGSSALAAAAYRSASRLHDQRLDRHHDFTNKAGVVHSEVLLPEHAPEAWRDRERLWNDVEAAELRKDAQLAREIEFALPRELDQADAVDLARTFVEREFVARGMVADLNVHWDIGEDGLAKPHAHVMLPTREVNEDGFGAKVRDWNRTDLLEHWRKAWAEHVNQRLAECDIDASVDHRSLEAQGVALEPQHKIGPAGARRLERGEDAERAVDHLRIARENGARIIAEPRIALDAITHQQATFTARDLAKFVHRHSDGKEQYDRVLATVRGSPELVALGRDGRGEERFTSRAMLATEQRLERATIKLEAHVGHGMAEQHRKLALTRAELRGLALSSEQQAAFDHVTRGRDLGVVIGYAGTGKSAMLGVAREAWESAGYDVRGAALSGIAAESLEHGSGIASRSIASLEHQWSQDRDLLTAHDVLVIDEAGMIGTRQLERVVAEAERRGAKLVLVGDSEQLQAIEAGAAFRAIAERHGHVEITEIRRQQENWQRRATRELATDRTDQAIAAYDRTGHVHAAETREAARLDLIERWDRERAEAPDASRIILTHTNDEVRLLNEAARERLRTRDELGDDIRIVAGRGAREFASGDRVMFLQNERGLGVKNGSLGNVQSVTSARMAVLLDDGRAVAFDLKDYNQLDHGYAATTHKAQGMTVDRVHVLATPGLDRHAAYVALSRHREQVDLYYGRNDFADRDRLVATLSRERGKEMASDYGRAFSDRRAIVLPAPAVERAAPTPRRDPFTGLELRRTAPTPTRSMFNGLRLRTSAPMVPTIDPSHDLGAAVRRYAAAFAEVDTAERIGRAPMPHQRTALEKATERLDQAQSGDARDLRIALLRDPDLIADVKQGRTAAAIQAMTLERELRADPARRADRFVADWRRLDRHRVALDGAEKFTAASRVTQQMGMMAKSLERDRQVESLLQHRVRELGIEPAGGMSMSQDLQRWLGLSRSRGLDR